MGQCMSRKAAGAFAASAAVSHNRPEKMHKRKQLRSPDDENNKGRQQRLSPQDTNKRFLGLNDQSTTRGVATSFGFKRRPTTAPAISSNASAARRLANAANDALDRNGNDADTDALTSNVVPTGRSTPRLAPPKKEPNATKVSRFGFRQTQGSRQNKVADLNCPADVVNQNRNNNALRKPVSIGRPVAPTDNNNTRSKIMLNAEPPPQQLTRFTSLQSTQLPRPEPIRVIETKTAKTLANNNRRVAGMNQQHLEETSSKDGSITEDSGVGSQFSGCLGEMDVTRVLNHFDASPTFGARRQFGQTKPRNLEVVVTAKNTFDVKDMDDSNDSCDSMTAPPLPQLPSAFYSSGDNRNNSYQSNGLVRERALEYQRLLDRNKQRMRKVSKTSSEGFSDDYGEEEKTYRDLCRNEKSFAKPLSHPTFLKSRNNQLKDDSSPASSDEHEWGHGGEAMADDVSFSLSSSDESKDKNHDDSVPISSAVIGSAIQSLMSGSLSKAFTATASKEVKNVMLTIEDPKFAAVAAASNQASLLDDETLLSPSDSISHSESEEFKRKLNSSSSNSKDINEKLTPPSPGTPTNASNSFSLSDGKEDFLIDDEIADQPALMFEDTMSMHQEISSETLMESTPKPKRKIPMGFEGSPMSSRRGKYSQNRTGSLDTLSPCESITSDDLMMDFYLSQSSGLDECEGQSSGYPSINDTLIQKNESEGACRGSRDCSSLFGNRAGQEKQKRSTPSRSRLLSARASTPNTSSLAESPRSLESRMTRVGRPSATSSPIRHSRISNLSSTAAGGYDSDDSVRLDRTNHKAMKQDIVSIKTMLLKLRRVLNETGEEELMRSETHNPFESHHLTNGIFNGPCLTENDPALGEDNAAKARFEVAELRRQVLFLQGQLEDREKTVQSLRDQMIKLNEDNYHANSAPASTISCDTCNAATQTERIRPISAGPSLLNGSSVDGSAGSLVSVNEYSPTRRSRLPSQVDPSRRTPSRLWRQPGEPPSPPRYANNSSSILRRAHSRTRTPASTS